MPPKITDRPSADKPVDRRGAAARALRRRAAAAGSASRRSSWSSTPRRSTSRRARRELLARLHGDPRFKLELPAAQIEIVDDARGERRGRRRPARAGARRARGGGRAGAAHRERRRAPVRRRARRAQRAASATTRCGDEYGEVAERQLVFGLHVHVAVGDADTPRWPSTTRCAPTCPRSPPWPPTRRSTTVRDTRLASVRPRISDLLPRQGVPPAIGSLDAFASGLQWGRARARVPSPRRWWWALRAAPEVRHGRDPRARRTGDGRRDARRSPASCTRSSPRSPRGTPAARRCRWQPTWRIEENRWSAAPLRRRRRDGRPRDRPSASRRRSACCALLDELGDDARRLGCAERARHGARDGRGRRSGGRAAPRRARGATCATSSRWLADRLRARRRK